MSATVPALSIAGDVLGMQTTEVNPPRAAAAVPVAMVSLAVWPGSRRCTCKSIRPGTNHLPAGFNPLRARRAPGGGAFADGGDFSVDNQQVRGGVEAVRGVNDPAAGQKQRVHAAQGYARRIDKASAGVMICMAQPALPLTSRWNFLNWLGPAPKRA